MEIHQIFCYTVYTDFGKKLNACCSCLSPRAVYLKFDFILFKSEEIMINHLGTKTLETNRLVLRKHEFKDADDMFHNWVTDPEVSRFWGWQPHESIDQTKSLLAEWIKEYEKIDTYHWIIELKEISQAIGYIYLNEFDNIEGSASVHYALSRKFWNQGIMTEACKEVLNFAFSALRVKKINSRHHIDNPASGAVMRRCGMQYIKTEYRPVPDCEQISGDYSYYEII